MIELLSGWYSSIDLRVRVAIMVIFGMIGVGIKWYWSRRKTLPRWKYMLDVSPVNSIGMTTGEYQKKTLWGVRITNTSEVPISIYGASLKVPRAKGPEFSFGTRPENGNYPVTLRPSETVLLRVPFPVQMNQPPWTERARNLKVQANRPHYTIDFGGKFEDFRLTWSEARTVYRCSQ